MGNPPTLLNDRTCEDRNLKIIKLDEQFIVASQANQEALYFISTETLEVFKCLSGINYDNSCAYDRGLLFQCHDDWIIRILDVTSGTYFNDVRIPFQSKDNKFIKLLDTWACSNSTVMVIGWKGSKPNQRRVSNLSVYDLEAVKKPNSDPGRYLLYTLQFQLDIDKFVMNESEIAVIGKDGKGDRSVTVLKFANFSFAEPKSADLKENPEANENVKMKAIYDPYVDCYPCY